MPIRSQTGNPMDTTNPIGTLKRQYFQSNINQITSKTLFSNIGNEDIKTILVIFQDYLISSRKNKYNNDENDNNLIKFALKRSEYYLID